MSRSIPRAAILALGLAFGVMAAVPARADAPAPRGLSCAQAGWTSDGACRAAAYRRAPRPDFARVRAQGDLRAAAYPLAARYVSLLILGIGY